MIVTNRARNRRAMGEGLPCYPQYVVCSLVVLVLGVVASVAGAALPTVSSPTIAVPSLLAQLPEPDSRAGNPRGVARVHWLLEQAQHHHADNPVAGLLLAVEASNLARRRHNDQLGRVQATLANLLTRHIGNVVTESTATPIALGFGPDGKQLAAAYPDHVVRLWSRGRWSRPGRVLHGSSSVVTSLDFSPDGRWLLGQNEEGMLLAWATASQDTRAVSLFQTSTGRPDYAFSADGRWLLASKPDAAPQLWRVGEWSQPHALPASPNSAAAMAIAADGGWVAVAGGNGIESNPVHIWSPARLEHPPRQLGGLEHPVRTLAFDPQGRWLAVSDGGATIRLWQPNHWDQGPILLQRPFETIETLRFSPDGRWLLAELGNHTPLIWRTGDWARAPQELAVDQHRFRQWTFSRDGRWLAAVDRSLQLWRTDNWERVDPIPEARGSFQTALSPDGTWLATTYDDSLRIHDLALISKSVPAPVSQPLGTLVQQACRQAGRNLTLREWYRVFGGEIYRRTCPNLVADERAIKITLSRGQRFAWQGEADKAIRVLNRMARLTPQKVSVLDEVTRWQALGRADRLASRGNLDNAVAAVAKAHRTDVKLATLEAMSLRLCWQGLIWQQSDTVASLCQQPVHPLHEGGKLAMAVLFHAEEGNFTAALTAVGNLIRNHHNVFSEFALLVDHPGWIMDLLAGKNPFDGTMLARLRGQGYPFFLGYRWAFGFNP